MARGAVAKVAVKDIIKEAFKSDFAGEQDGKLYVWANDGGERVQICLSMTCPKTAIGTTPAPSGDGYDFESMDLTSGASAFKTAEITEEETRNIEELMKKLGL